MFGIESTETKAIQQVPSDGKRQQEFASKIISTELYKDIIGGLQAAHVDIFNNNISSFIQSDERQIILLYEAGKRNMVYQILRDDKQQCHALEFEKGIVILSEIKTGDGDLVGITTQTRRVLEQYVAKKKPIYLCFNKNGTHYTTLAVIPGLDEKGELNNKASYRYIEPLQDNKGDFVSFNENEKEHVDRAFSVVFTKGVSVLLNIDYKRQQYHVNGYHNNECGIHNVFNTLLMLQQGPAADMAKMRQYLTDIPGNNPSQNGGIDPDDTQHFLRPYYSQLFNLILNKPPIKSPIAASASQKLLSTLIDFEDLQAQINLIGDKELQKEVHKFVTFANEKTKKIDRVISTTKSYQDVVCTTIENIQGQANYIATLKIKNNEDEAIVRTILRVINNPCKTLFEEIANEALVKDDISFQELQWKVQALHCQQQLLLGVSGSREAFEIRLGQLAELINRRVGNYRPSLFISYAWPAQQYRATEYWLQPFLRKLHRHLHQLGINVILDIVDNKPGGNIVEFMEKAKDANFVLLICTESLRVKHLYGNGLKAVNTELNNIGRKRKADDERGLKRVLPYLVTGTHATSYPANYELYSTVRDWRGASYLEVIQALITQIFPIDKEDKEFNDTWSAFTTVYPAFSAALPQAQVEEFLKQEQYKKEWQVMEMEAGYQELIKQFSYVTHASDLSEPTFIEQLRTAKQPDLNEEELQYYIPVNGCWNNNYNQSFDLEKEVFKFLAGNKKVLLLLGNAGAGKTLFCQYIALKFSQQKVVLEQKNEKNQNVTSSVVKTSQKHNQPIVLYIPLPNFTDPLHDLIEKKLKRDGLTDEQIKYLKDNRQQFVFILDGYDEIKVGLYQNLYISNRLDQWNAQVIISCRSSYLINVNDYRTTFTPSQNGKVDRMGLSEISLVPFSDDQIDLYIKKYLSNNPEAQTVDDEPWGAAKYRHYIDMLPGLKILITTPYLLRILMEVLPRVVKEYNEVDSDERLPLTVAKLYDYFMDSYFDRQRDKLLLACALPDDGHDVREDFREYSKQLAIEMWKRDLVHVVYRSPSRLFSGSKNNEDNPWELFFNNTNKDMVRAREGCPIRRLPKDEKDDEERWAFIHYSLQEYFTTREIFDSCLARDAKALDKLKSQAELMPSGIRLEEKADNKQAPSTAPLSTFFAKVVEDKTTVEHSPSEVPPAKQTNTAPVDANQSTNTEENDDEKELLQKAIEMSLKH